MQFKPNFNPEYLLLDSGYIKGKRGWVRKVKEQGDRFHALVKDDVIDIHYDKIVKYNNKTYHSSAPKELLLRKEAKRLRRIQSNLAIWK